MHTRRTFALVTLCGLLAAAAANPALSDAVPQVPEIKPLVQWAGHETKSNQRGFSLITDETAWRQLWTSHAGLEFGHGAVFRNYAPLIDFDRGFIVAYFRGPSTNEDGEILVSIAELPDQIRLRFERSSFQTASFDGTDHGMKTTPYGIWLVPKPAGGIAVPIVIEEARRGLKDEPITWKEVHRIEPLAK